jgi:hypothetical protein
MFYSESTLTGIFQEIIIAARTGDYSSVSTLLQKSVVLLQNELKKHPLKDTSLSKLSYSLETIASMQQMQNWVALADILEYEFIPLWKTLAKG